MTTQQSIKSFKWTDTLRMTRENTLYHLNWPNLRPSPLSHYSATRLLCIFLFLLQSGCSSLNLALDIPQEPDTEDLRQQRAESNFATTLSDYYQSTQTADITEGERLFNTLCIRCHARESQQSIKHLFRFKSTKAGQPPDLKQQQYQENKSEEYLYLRIQYGKKNELTVHSMPSWEAELTAEDINNLVAYIMNVSR